MSAYRDPKTDRWMFRATVRFPDGSARRMSGTPGAPGVYQDLGNSKAGAVAAEQRCKLWALTGRLYIDGTAVNPAEPAPVPRGIPTIAEYAPTFLANHRPGSSPRQVGSKRQILEGHILPALGGLRLDEIRQADVDAFASAELSRCAPKTVNNRLAVLSSLLRYAADNGLCPQPSVQCFVAAIKTSDRDVAAVPEADVERLIAASSGRLRLGVLLAAEAGLRIGELRGAQHGDVVGGELRVIRALTTTGDAGDPKHKRRRAVPLTARLAAEIARAPRHGLWLTANPDGTPWGYYAARDELRALYLAAGVEIPRTEEGVTMPWHSLRHSFGTRCSDRGVDLATIQELMGHESMATTRRYITVTAARRRAMVTLAFDAPIVAASTLPVRPK